MNEEMEFRGKLYTKRRFEDGSSGFECRMKPSAVKQILDQFVWTRAFAKWVA